MHHTDWNYKMKSKFLLVWKSSIFLFYLISFVSARTILHSNTHNNPVQLRSNQRLPLHLHHLRIRGGSYDSSKSWSWGANPTRQRPSSSSFNQQQQRQQQQQQQQQPVYPIVEDITDQEEQQYQTQSTKDAIDSFLVRGNRNSFITRVYAILTTQLLFTALTVLYFATHRHIPIWMATQGRMIVPTLSIAISAISMGVMAMSENARRKSPLKWQLLSLFTLGESIAIGFITSFYPIKTILTAFLSTAAATGSVTMYTLLQNNSKYDLSQTGRTLTSASLLFLVYGILHLCFPGFLPYSEMLYSLFGTCLFSFYLSYHTRLIVSGEHSKYQMNDKDYVFGAMTLYGDIINIFLYILRILGNVESDD